MDVYIVTTGHCEGQKNERVFRNMVDASTLATSLAADSSYQRVKPDEWRDFEIAFWGDRDDGYVAIERWAVL